jgi:hypothetical protein
MYSPYWWTEVYTVSDRRKDNVQYLWMPLKKEDCKEKNCQEENSKKESQEEKEITCHLCTCNSQAASGFYSNKVTAGGAVTKQSRF